LRAYSIQDKGGDPVKKLGDVVEIGGKRVTITKHDKLMWKREKIT